MRRDLERRLDALEQRGPQPARLVARTQDGTFIGTATWWLRSLASLPARWTLRIGDDDQP